MSHNLCRGLLCIACWLHGMLAVRMRLFWQAMKCRSAHCPFNCVPDSAILALCRTIALAPWDSSEHKLDYGSTAKSWMHSIHQQDEDNTCRQPSGNVRSQVHCMHAAVPTDCNWSGTSAACQCSAWPSSGLLLVEGKRKLSWQAQLSSNTVIEHVACHSFHSRQQCPSNID